LKEAYATDDSSQRRGAKQLSATDKGEPIFLREHIIQLRLVQRLVILRGLQHSGKHGSEGLQLGESTLGQSVSSVADISGSTGSRNVHQESGVVSGAMNSIQTASVQGNDIGIAQVSNIAGNQGL